MNYWQIMKTIVSSTKWCRFNSLSIGIESYVDFTFLRRRFYVQEQQSDQRGLYFVILVKKKFGRYPLTWLKKIAEKISETFKEAIFNLQ